MGLSITLNNFAASNPRLPKAEDFGGIPKRNLGALYDFAGADTYLLDKSGNGNDITLTPGGRWSWAGDVLTANGGGPSTFTTKLRRLGNVFTAIAAFRSRKDGQNYLLTNPDGQGISLLRAQSHAGYYYAPTGGGINGTSGQSANAQGKSFDSWVLYAVACDGARVFASVDGNAWGDGDPISAAGIYALGPNALLSCGTNDSVVEGDFGLVAYWHGKLTDAEIRSTYVAARWRMARKGYAL